MSRIDSSALRFNQGTIVAVVILGFVLGSDRGVWLLLALGIALAIGAAFPGNGPLQLLYRKVVAPLGLLKPHPEIGDPSPHRFAQAMGGGCLLVASALLFGGADVAGWLIAWLVVSLALVNLLFGFCAGCFLFLQLDRILHLQAGGQ